MAATLMTIGAIACGGSDNASAPTATSAPAPTPAPTRAPSTSTPVPAATAASAPTATSAPAATATATATRTPQPTATAAAPATSTPVPPAPTSAPVATATPAATAAPTVAPTATPVLTFSLTIAGVAITGGNAASGAGGGLNIAPGPNAPGGKYTAGTKLALTAVSNPDFDQLSWNGACAGTPQGSTCFLSMDGDREASATFIRLPSLTVNGQQVSSGTVSLNNGSVGVTPPPNAEGSQTRFRAGTKVTLTTNGAPGYAVLQWSGGCTGTGSSCSLTMDGDKTVTVTFAPVQLSINSMPVNSNLIAVANGAVEITPPPDVAGTLFTPGTKITLKVTPNVGMAFKSWGGACLGQGAICTLTMDQAKQVTVVIGP